MLCFIDLESDIAPFDPLILTRSNIFVYHNITSKFHVDHEQIF